MRQKAKYIFQLLLVAALVASCGDLGQNEKPSRSIEQFKVCSIDFDKLTEFLDKSVASELDCLEDNLDLFMEVVESDQPGYLSRSALKTFVTDNFEDLDESMILLLDQVFELASVLYKENPNYISSQGVSKLVSLMKFLNSELVAGNIKEHLSFKESEHSFDQHFLRKAIVKNTFQKISNRVLEEIDAEGNNYSLNIMDFLEPYRNEDNSELLDKLEDLLFVKPIFFQGDQESFSASEFKNLARDLPQVGVIAFDFINLKSVQDFWDHEEDIFGLLKEDVSELISFIPYEKNSLKVLFEYGDVVKVLELFDVKVDFFNQYQAEFLKVKSIFTGNESTLFTVSDLMKVIDDLILNFLKRSVFIYRAYEFNESLVETNGYLSQGLLRSFYVAEEEEEYADDFNFILSNYRLFKGRDTSPMYNYDYDRSALAMVEISFLQDVFTLLAKRYGNRKDSARGGYKINLSHVNNIINDFRAILIGEELMIEEKLESTANTIALMTSLFQPNSNGDADMEVTEMSEFAISLYSAFNLMNLVFDQIENFCPVDSKSQSFNKECFKANFFNLMSTETSNGNYISSRFPHLMEFIENLNSREFERLFVNVDNLSRDCSHFSNGASIPLKKFDVFMYFSSLIAIEQTFLRHDVNRNNIIDPDEVENAYSIYSSAVIAILPDPGLEKYAKDIFLYLMKHERIPEVEDVGFFKKVGGMIKFITFKWFRSQRVTSTRFTIGAVLEVIAEQTSTYEPVCDDLSAEFGIEL